MKTSRFLLAFVVFGAVASSLQAAAIKQAPGAPGAVALTVASLQALKVAPMPHPVAPPQHVVAAPAFQYPLVSGWAPAQATALAAGKPDFGLLPRAGYLTDSGPHPDGAIKAKTELSGKFEAAKSIAEPASELLLLVALAALAIAVRRRLPG